MSSYVLLLQKPASEKNDIKVKKSDEPVVTHAKDAHEIQPLLFANRQKTSQQESPPIDVPNSQTDSQTHVSQCEFLKHSVANSHNESPRKQSEISSSHIANSGKTKDTGELEAKKNKENQRTTSAVNHSNIFNGADEEKTVINLDHASFSWNSEGTSFMLKDLSFAVEKGGETKWVSVMHVSELLFVCIIDMSSNPSRVELGVRNTSVSH